MDTVRKELEMCDQFQGFVFNYSASGGTATSIMSKLEGQIHNMYRPAYSNLILPSTDKLHLSCAPYNFLFSLSNTVENRAGKQICATFDNMVLSRICNKQLKVEDPGLRDLN